MMRIAEKENEIIRQMKKAKSEGGKVYCLGAAQLGRSVKKEATIHGITIDAFLISKKNFNKEEHSVEGIPVLCLEDMARNGQFSQKDLLVVTFIAYSGCDNGIINRYRSQLTVCNEDATSLFEFEAGKKWDYDFFSLHRDEFELLYHDLADNRSRDCMEAFWNQKISGKFSYLDEIYDNGQYLDSDIVNFSIIESYIDCGAFDGDTFLAFREAYKVNVGKEYKGIAYLLEPDKANYQKMVANCSQIGGDNKFLQCGAWNKQGELRFSQDGSTASQISKDGKTSINVDCIDNIVQGREVNFIKMDIEGAELKALEGARETIKTYKPILAVCVYHKRDDLLTIPAYIRSICSEYKFYIRAYERYSRELVLYAVCG